MNLGLSPYDVCVFGHLQTEQLVEQEILIKRLRGDLMTSRLGTAGSSVETEPSVHSARRPYSAPLVGDSRRHQPARKVRW